MAKLISAKTMKAHVLGEDQVLIGRHPSCTIQVLEKQVSRTHCLVTRSPEGWVLSDTGSMLGTYINGEHLLQPRCLQPGDQIRVGNELFVFDDDSPGPRKAMTLHPLAEASPGELVPFDAPTRRHVRPMPVILGLAIAAVVVGGFLAVLVLTRESPSQVVRRAARLLEARNATALWGMMTDARRQAMTFDEFRDQIGALPDEASEVLKTLKLGTPSRSDQGILVPVYVTIQGRPFSDNVVLYREGGEWRIHSVPVAWLERFAP